VATHTGAPAPGLAQDDGGPVWHTLSADEVLRAEKVDEHSGLASAEVASRAERFGPNKFDTGKAEPRWRAFIRQYADLMQIRLHRLLPRRQHLQHRRGRSVPAAADPVDQLHHLALPGDRAGLRHACRGPDGTPARPPEQPILTRGRFAWLMSVGLVMGVGTLGVISWAEQAHTREIAHTMGVVNG
jgi:hypothetical protein